MYVNSLGVQECDVVSLKEDLVVQEKLGLSMILKMILNKVIVFSLEVDKMRVMGDFMIYWYYFVCFNFFGVIVLIMVGFGWGFCINFFIIWLKFWLEDVVLFQLQWFNVFYNGLYVFFQLGVLMFLFFLVLVVFIFMIIILGVRFYFEMF